MVDKLKYSPIILVVETNMGQADEFELVNYLKVQNKMDIIVFLFSYKEFKRFDMENKIIFNFCGVRKN